MAGEVAVATATLGQTAKEMTKETPELKDHNGKLLGGALKVKVGGTKCFRFTPKLLCYDPI